MDVGGGIGYRPSGMATLPVADLRTIFTFVTSDGTELQRLARVSHEWRECAVAIMSANALRQLAIQTSTAQETPIASREVLLELRRQVTLRGVRLRELRILVCDLSADTFSSWSALLMHAPRLETLLVDCVGDALTDSLQYIPIITAAARRCRRLHTLCLLSLPTSVTGTVAMPLEEKAVVDALVPVILDSLPAWKRFGGLRNLVVSIPFAQLAHAHAKATKFILTVADSCPLLETVSFQGKNVDLHGGEFLEQVEQWHIDLGTWERFCASCTELTEFDWIVVPFATAFFEAFGRFRKPKLDVLKLSRNWVWDWDAYHRHYPSLAADGYDTKARRARLVLSACPALRVLAVRFEIGQQKLFGDDFVTAIAQYCQQLEELEIMTTEQDHFVLTRLTDLGISALSTLPRLAWVEVHAANMTGRGLFTLVAFSRYEGQRQRTYTFTFGDLNEPRCVAAFYDVALQFLAALADYDVADEGGQAPTVADFGRVVLHVKNGLGRVTAHDRHWRESYLASMLDLVDVVMAKFPQARLRLRVEYVRWKWTNVWFVGGWSESVHVRQRLSCFYSIDELVFYTEGASCLTGYRDGDTHIGHVDAAMGDDDDRSEHSEVEASENEDEDLSMGEDDDRSDRSEEVDRIEDGDEDVSMGDGDGRSAHGDEVEGSQDGSADLHIRCRRCGRQIQ